MVGVASPQLALSGLLAHACRPHHPRIASFELTDDELVKALVRHSDALGTLGQSTRARDCMRVASELRNAVRELEMANGEVSRREQLANAPTARADDPVALMLVQAVRNEWRVVVDQMRESGNALLATPVERRSSPRVEAKRV